MRKMDSNITLTIEQRLKVYSEVENHTERHETLWHEWNHNKKVLSRIQELIYTSFPSYSLHDVSHSEAVVHNIEMMLGEENIKALSATDCFALLHTVYIHDIGMCITHNEKKEIIADSKFHDYLENMKRYGDTDIQKYAKILLDELCSGRKKKQKSKDDYKHILDEKLGIFYAIMLLLPEYRRMEHGTKSREKLIRWVSEKDKFGSDFSTIEVPKRIFYTIAECAATHTNWDFQEVLKLSQVDTGYAHDYYHPRFIAVLLQLGDALDIDNNRFHPLTEQFVPLLNSSRLHLGKHEAIRKLLITNKIIEIFADCKTQEEVRLIRHEWDGINKVLKNATYYWSVIRPEDSSVCLPTLNPIKLFLNGVEVPSELIDTQFKISQERAFALLKGNSIYEDTKYVFLRELLQNAIDATKLQYSESCLRIKGVESLASCNPDEMHEILNPENYPIDIKLKLCWHENDCYEEINKKKLDQNNVNDKIGILVEIADSGTGISRKDLKQISDVGTSYSNREKHIKRMPEWLQPTGRFGIGMQSVYLCSNRLDAKTHARNGEQYDITFYSRDSVGVNGYINVIVVNDNERRFGSTFQVFVPYSKLLELKIIENSTDYLDPFAISDSRIRKLHDIRIVIKNMAEYLAKLIEEPLFPITVEVYDIELKNDETKRVYDGEFKKLFGNVGLKLYYSQHFIKNAAVQYEILKNDDDKPVTVKSDLTWAYKKNDKNKDEKCRKDAEVHKTKDGNLFYLDVDTAKVFIWHKKHKAYACFGSDRIQSMSEYYYTNLLYEAVESDTGIRIYYKGVLTTYRKYGEDANLMEYIDFKDTLDKNYLNLNRNGFSEEGLDYLENVYKDLVQLFRQALRYFSTGKDTLREIKSNTRKSCEDSNVKMKKLNHKIKTWLKATEKQEDGNEDVEKEREKERENDIEKYLEKIQQISPEEIQTATEKNEKDKWILQRWKHTVREQRKYIISVVMLVYYSKLRERDNYVENIDDTDKLWDEVLEYADVFVNVMKQMTYKGNILDDDNNRWKISTLFNLTIYKKIKVGYSSDKSGNIMNLIHSDFKLAIMSVRINDKSKYVRYLFKLSDGHKHNELKDAIQKLRLLNGTKEAFDKIEQIEKNYCEELFIQDESFSESMNEKEQILISWMLENIPTMAVFMNENKKRQINVLDSDINGSVYFNRNIKKCVLDAILDVCRKKNKNTIRFSIDTWSGYHKLSVPIKGNRIEHIKVGDVSGLLNSKMILPLTGDQLIQFINECEELIKERIDKRRSFFEKFLTIKKSIIDGMTPSKTDDESEVTSMVAEDKFWSVIQSCQFSMDDCDIKKLDEEWSKIRLNNNNLIADIHIESEISNEKKNEEKNKICVMATLFNRYISEIMYPDIPWMKYLTGDTFQCLQKYIIDNSPCHPSEYQIFILYGKFLQELGMIVTCKYMEDFKKEFDIPHDFSIKKVR